VNLGRNQQHDVIDQGLCQCFVCVLFGNDFEPFAKTNLPAFCFHGVFPVVSPLGDVPNVEADRALDPLWQTREELYENGPWEGDG